MDILDGVVSSATCAAIIGVGQSEEGLPLPPVHESSSDHEFADPEEEDGEIVENSVVPKDSKNDPIDFFRDIQRLDAC